jgi:hypothetical protein
VLAELEHHMVELNNTVRRVSVARDEIAMLEASADANSSSVQVASTRRLAIAAA